MVNLLVEKTHNGYWRNRCYENAWLIFMKIPFFLFKIGSDLVNHRSEFSWLYLESLWIIIHKFPITGSCILSISFKTFQLLLKLLVPNKVFFQFIKCNQLDKCGSTQCFLQIMIWLRTFPEPIDWLYTDWLAFILVALETIDSG